MPDIFSLYRGFTIDQPAGNNAFSYDLRKQKSIRIAPLVRGNIADLAVSEHIAFSELLDGTEYAVPGLQNFIHWKYASAECFIFDNHNHAFFFWAYALRQGLFSAGTTLVHLDQHTDMRRPQKYIPGKALADLEKVFYYTNFELNVGNFIRPALQAGIFKTVEIIDNSESFAKNFSEPFVLDVDIDIFSPDMDYIRTDLKTNKIRELARQARFITVATSPFFIDQKTAINRIKQIFYDTEETASGNKRHLE